MLATCKVKANIHAVLHSLLGVIVCNPKLGLLIHIKICYSTEPVNGAPETSEEIHWFL